MGTKDLSRSAIEGGRYRFNQWRRRHSNRVVRAREKIAERAFQRDPGSADDGRWPERERVCRAFFDRLSAPERWLESQVGRGWNRVRSEMFARFDTRTLAGRHIVFDHLLPVQRFYEEPGVWRVARVRFRVDDRGILRRLPPEDAPVAGVWPRAPREPDSRVLDALCELVAGRKLIARGAHVFWLVPVAVGDGVRYRQHRRLTPAELATWRTFAADVQALVLLVDPTDVDPTEISRARASGDRSASPAAPRPGCRPVR